MAKTATEERIKRLKSHLDVENPALAEAVSQFQELDRIARKLGFMGNDESYATQISWWPVVAVLGTYSAGKSTFLNEYLGKPLQRTGNQAVDDKFTVLAYGSDAEAYLLPGLALDSDPRFPFYQISRDIEAVAAGEGKRVDAYLQLRTANSPELQGKIFIDSPGFDADQQRTLAALVDRIIPPTDTPGAAEAGVPQFIDMMLAEWYAPEERAAFLAGLAETEQRAQAEAGTAFADLDEEAQTTFVAALDAETYAAERESAEPEVDGDVAGAGQQGTYQAQEELEEDPAGTQGELGEAMSDEAAAADSSAEEPQAASGAPPFFRQLKELTLAGYYTSEVGATEELRWNAAPGRYDADVPFSEIGRAWA